VIEWLMYGAAAALLVFFIVGCLGLTALVAQSIWRLLRGRSIHGERGRRLDRPDTTL
jgi:hypothetical protein